MVNFWRYLLKTRAEWTVLTPPSPSTSTSVGPLLAVLALLAVQCWQLCGCCASFHVTVTEMAQLPLSHLSVSPWRVLIECVSSVCLCLSQRTATCCSTWAMQWPSCWSIKKNTPSLGWSATLLSSMCFYTPSVTNHHLEREKIDREINIDKSIGFKSQTASLDMHCTVILIQSPGK